MNRQQLSTNEVIWYDADRISEPLDCLFDIGYWQAEKRVIGSASGRGTTWFIQTKSNQAALRHYKRGGLFGKLVEDLYFFYGWEKTRSFAELTLLQHLRAHGVNVPRPIAARAIRNGAFYRADIISEKIANASDLVSILSKRALSKQEYQSIGSAIALMHKSGVDHTDLNIHNILLDDHGIVWIIDFDKCAIRQGNAFKQQNLARLQRSFMKERNKHAINWQGSDFQALLSGYNMK